MTDDLLTEYRILSASPHSVVVSLFAHGLRNTVLLQLLRLDTGIGRAFSVYAVYREGSMSFEAGARLTVEQTGASLLAMLHQLVADAEFLGSLTRPLAVEVEEHFAGMRALRA